jgi:hypothetical protein
MKTTQNETIREIYDKLSAQKKGQTQKKYKLKESDVIQVVKEAKEMLKKESMLLRV